MLVLSIRVSIRRTAHAPAPAPSRRLDPLAVEAALNGHRPYRELPAPEAAEVLRILRRRGDRLHQVAALLDVDPRVIAVAYIAASGAR